MPITPRCHPLPPIDEHVVRADGRVGFDRLLGFRDELRLLLLPPGVFVAELLRERARFFPQRFVGREQQAGRDVGRAHAPGGIDARRQHESDVITVDRLAGQAGGVEQRPEPDGVGSA